MSKATDELKEERLNNQDLVPFDENAHNIEVVKEQILDLNDKFDFLVTLLLKGQKLGVQVDEDENNNGPVIKDFNLNDDGNSSLNQDKGVEFDLKDEKSLLKAVKSFESKARENVGKDRKQYRKPEPRKTIVERVREAMKQQEEEEDLRNA